MSLYKKNDKNIFLWFKNAAKDFFEYAAMIINSILLSVVYVFGVSLTFFLAKILRKKFLDLEIDKSKKSYYQDFDQKSASNYFKQF